jgi:biopolymer transport protein TolR
MGMKAGGGDDLNSEINVTPLVDVMLVLLIIFMVTAPLLNTGVDIDLPEVTAQKLEDPEDKLVLSINERREVFLAKTQIPWTELEVKIATNERVIKEKVLHIEAAATLPYAVVVTAMAVAKDAGVKKVLLLTDPAEHLDLAGLQAGRIAPVTPVTP